jgi:hypothetical protein
MAWASEIWVFAILFAGYGIYSAATEGVAKAWISSVAGKEKVATEIGFYSGFQSVCLLLASSITGLVWYSFGAAAAFSMTALVTVGVAIYLSAIKSEIA